MSRVQMRKTSKCAPSMQYIHASTAIYDNQVLITEVLVLYIHLIQWQAHAYAMNDIEHIECTEYFSNVNVNSIVGCCNCDNNIWSYEQHVKRTTIECVYAFHVSI